MKKLIATLALLAATTAPALADNCSSLTFKMNSTVDMIGYESDNIDSYTTMMNSATSVGDIAQAKMYVEMGKDSIIRQKGNAAKARRILDQVAKEPNKCGLTDAQFAEVDGNLREMDKAIDEALSTYKKHFGK